MYSKLAIFFIASAALVSAVPTSYGEPAVDPVPPTIINNTTTNKCNVGTLQCCKSAQDAKSSAVQSALGLLGIPIGSVQGLVGLTCNPISVIGVGGNNCNAAPVCCKNNSFSGVVALGCTPINLSL